MRLSKYGGFGLLLVACKYGVIEPEPLRELPCLEEVVALDGQLDEALPELEFTPRQILDLVVGQHRESLSWQEAPYEYSPGVGDSDISIEVSRAGAPRLVERYRQAQAGEEFGGSNTGCSNSLEIPVFLAISTADGVLDERVETMAEARAIGLARIDAELDVGKLRGSFEASPPDTEGVSYSVRPSLAIGLRLSVGGLTGEIGVVSNFEEPDGELVARTSPANVAEFPAENYCGIAAVTVSSDNLLDSISIEQTLRQLNAGFPVKLLDSPVTLSAHFTSEATHVCQSPASAFDGQLSSRFTGSVLVEASDGSVQGTFDVEFSTLLSGSGDATYSANAGGNIFDLSQAPELLRSFGIDSELDFNGYQGAQIGWRFQSTAGRATGAFVAYGLLIPDCISSAMPGESCQGIDSEEIWRLSWRGEPLAASE